MENLFSYGTLRDEAVQRAVFGRTLDSVQDAIAGYRLTTMRVGYWDGATISGGHVQQTLVPAGGETVTGLRLRVTEQELQLADGYEPKEYRRLRVRLCSGNEAWVYLRA